MVYWPRICLHSCAKRSTLNYIYMNINHFLEDAAATEALGAGLATSLVPGALFYLHGELGAGKTTLVRGLLRALGHQGAVKSPTYTLVEPYQIGAWRILHWDLYRLAEAEELEFLGLREQLDGEAVLLVEWPQRGAGLLPRADVEIALHYAAAGRSATLTATTPRGQLVMRGVASAAS